MQRIRKGDLVKVIAGAGSEKPPARVLAVDDEPIGSGADLETQMERVQQQRAQRVVFLVRRGVSTLFLELEPDWEQR